MPNEFTKVYTSLGAADLNAHTWVEETVYKVSLPKTHLAHWAKMEADRFLHPVFRLFHTELEIVYEEKNRAIDNPARAIGDAVRGAVFKGRPYGDQTTLGHAEHLKRPSIRKIEAYYKTWYVPNNMAICISGDIIPSEAIHVIDREFSVLKKRPLPEAPEYNPDPPQDRREVAIDFPGEEQVMLAFHTAPRRHPDRPALTLIDMLMDNSAAGLINLNLNQKQKVRKAGSYPAIYNDAGAQYFYGIPKDGQSLEEVENLLLEQLEKIKAGEFEDWLLNAIITDYKIRERQRLEDNEQRVAMMRDAYLQFETWEEARQEIETLQKVTRKEIMAVAKKYFGKNYAIGLKRDRERKVESIENRKSIH